MSEPSILKTPPISSPAPDAPKGNTPDAIPVLSPSDAPGGELERARFEAAAARAGVDDAYLDTVEHLFSRSGKPATKENLASFMSALRSKQPALFTPASTAPPSNAAPPAPGVVQSATSKWEALKASGDRAAAELFYLMHRDAINRFA
jgi:hypothetical protein